MKVYFEEAIFGETLGKHQWRESIFNIVAENALRYRCFFRNLVKIYRKAILKNFSRCMRSKSQWCTHSVVFFNPSMPVVIKGDAYLNKPASLSWRFAQVCMSFCYHQELKGWKIFWKFLRNNQTKLKGEASYQLCSLKKLFWKFLEKRS